MASQSAKTPDGGEPGSPSDDTVKLLYCDEEFPFENDNAANAADDDAEENPQSRLAEFLPHSRVLEFLTPSRMEEVLPPSSMRRVLPKSRLSKVSYASDMEEVEQQTKANPPDESGLDGDLSLTSTVPNEESSKETIPEQQMIIIPGYPHTSADVPDRYEKGVRVFSPGNFSFQELLDSDGVECFNSDRGEPGAPSDAASSGVETRIPVHHNHDLKPRRGRRRRARRARRAIDR